MALDGSTHISSETDPNPSAVNAVAPSGKTSFSRILSDPVVRRRWEKIRKYNFLRESTYDMTNRCDLRCEGCYYYQGDKQFASEDRDPESWRALFQREKKRGITFVVLAGAEPALVPDLLEVCYQEIPLGCIASNGTHRIPESVGYKIHVSVWGNNETSYRIRKAKNLLEKQIDNYKNDPRAVFVYTFTPENVAETREVVETLAAHGCRTTFNVFSAPIGYSGPLKHTEESLRAVREMMVQLLTEYPDHILFSLYNAVVHTHRLGLHDLFSCPYPRMNPSTDIGLGRSFRQYRADLNWDRTVACCVPDTDCPDCRHYASGSAVVTARMFRHAAAPDTFKAWLDYVDNYLAVWVMGYERGENICQKMVSPPPAI